jgi:hypothetical protein
MRTAFARLGTFSIVPTICLTATAVFGQQVAVYRFESAPVAATGPYSRFFSWSGGDAAGKKVAFHGKANKTEGIFTADITDDNDDALEAERYDVAAPAAPFRRFARPSVNASGSVAWKAELTDGGGGVFRSGPSPVILIGDNVPLASGTFERFDLPIIADDGGVVFHSTVFGGPVVGPITVTAMIARCIGGDGNCHTGGTGILSALVAEGDALPDRPGRSICEVHSGISASSYGVSFTASTKLDCGSAVEIALEGVFRKAYAGAIVTVALSGESAEPVPGMAGTVYDDFQDVTGINNSGAVVFQANVTGVQTLNSIYVCTVGTCPLAPAIIAVSNGDLDSPDMMVLSKLFAARISDAGDVAFHADARKFVHTAGVYLWDSATDTVMPIARKGDVVPGLVPAHYFRKLYRPWMTPGGRIAFRATAKPAGGKTLYALFLYE